MNKRYYRYYTYIQPFLKIPFVKTYGLHILSIITMAVFIVFAIKPTVETILILQKKIADSKEILAKITQKSQNLSLAKENFRNLNLETKSKIQTAVPTNFELGNLIQALEQTTSDNQASMSALQIQPLTIDERSTALQNGVLSQSKTLTEILFTYNVEGSYQNLISVLDQLQTNSRLISLDNLIINKSDESGLIMSISGKAYYLK